MTVKKTTTKRKNPLFVVTNKGKDVEQAQTFLDALFKKIGLSHTVKEMEKNLQEFIHFLFSLVKNYAVFMAVKNILDQVVAKLEAVVKAVYPEAFFYKA